MANKLNRALISVNRDSNEYLMLGTVSGQQAAGGKAETAIGNICAHYSEQECWNYLKDAGYAPD